MERIFKIGVFDSGIGGVTVLKEIIKILPNLNYYYYSDSINNPYGEKTDKEVIDIADNITKNLIDNGAQAIVIACNTASAKAASFLREKYNNIPIIAMTANAFEEDKKKAFKAGMNAHVAKPIDIKTILSVFDQVFGRI